MQCCGQGLLAGPSLTDSCMMRKAGLQTLCGCKGKHLIVSLGQALTWSSLSPNPATYSSSCYTRLNYTHMQVGS